MKLKALHSRAKSCKSYFTHAHDPRFIFSAHTHLPVNKASTKPVSSHSFSPSKSHGQWTGRIVSLFDACFSLFLNLAGQ